MKKSNILALSLNRRYLGLALLVGDELCMARTKSLKHHRGRRKLKAFKKALCKAISEFIPRIIVLGRTSTKKYASRTAPLFEIAKQFGKKLGCRVIEYANREVKRALCQRVKPTHQNLAYELAKFYPVPELTRTLPARAKKGIRSYTHDKEKYHRAKYTAVGLALYHYLRTNQDEKRNSAYL